MAESLLTVQDCQLLGVSSNEAVLIEVVALEQMHREQQKVRMRCYRAKKKERIARMVQERLQLEKQFNARVSAYQIETRAVSDDLQGSGLATAFTECSHLTKENLVLQHALEQQKELRRVIASEYGKFVYQLQDSPLPPSLPDLHNQGWRVYFPNDEASFYFHPFKRSEYNSVMKSYDDLLPSSSPATGKLFDWTVHHAPVCRRDDGKVVARAKFTTRVRCVLDDVDALITSSDLSVWPLIVTPPNWSHDQRANVSTLVLQEFDKNAHVMVCSLPGDFHLRFFQFTRRVPMVNEESGKRSILFGAVATDSKANARSREAEDPDGNIVWVREGGHSVTFTEVNDGVVAVEYDHWAVCDDELHAQHLYIRWAHYVTTCYWSQRILTPKLIRSG